MRIPQVEFTIFKSLAKNIYNRHSQLGGGVGGGGGGGGGGERETLYLVVHILLYLTFTHRFNPRPYCSGHACSCGVSSNYSVTNIA